MRRRRRHGHIVDSFAPLPAGPYWHSLAYWWTVERRFRARLRRAQNRRARRALIWDIWEERCE